MPRYKMITQMRNHFWERWQREVLQQYQHRSKWVNTTDEVKDGDLVFIKDELLPPTKWPPRTRHTSTSWPRWAHSSSHLEDHQINSATTFGEDIPIAYRPARRPADQIDNSYTRPWGCLVNS